MAQHGLHLRKAGRTEDRHPRNGIQKSRIEYAMVSLAVGAHQSCPVHAEHYMQALNAHVVEEHIIGPLEKRRVDRKHRQHALLGHSRRHRGGMTLRDANIKARSGNSRKNSASPVPGTIAAEMAQIRLFSWAQRHIASPKAREKSFFEGWTGSPVSRQNRLTPWNWSGCALPGVALSLYRTDMEQYRAMNIPGILGTVGSGASHHVRPPDPDR